MFIKKSLLSKILLFLVSFSAGALIGGAFLHLLPEAVEKINSDFLFFIALSAFVAFFLIEKTFCWRHCHDGDCKVHTFGYMNLLGDGIHNFIDGLVIAATFLIDIKLGIVTTLAVALHEIPQEIGDFGVLIYAGFRRKSALIVNYLVALSVVLGGIVGFFAAPFLETAVPYLLPFAAGGFIYIAASDLMPEIRKERGKQRSAVSLIVFILGVALMFVLKFI